MRFHCLQCPADIEWTWTPDKPSRLDCPRCKRAIELSITDALRSESKIERCPLCDSQELYYRKDFPQALGVGVVVVAAIASFWLLTSHWFLSWGVLLAAILIDLLLYRIVGFVTCCYRCKAEFRGVRGHEAHGPFDLATAEKYH